jgi:membrane protein insertase Oxa1/YidC/SpoIIIJ
MWQDLAAVTPPLVVCVAFLIGVVMFLRHQLSPKRRAERDAKAAAEHSGEDRSDRSGS